MTPVPRLLKWSGPVSKTIWGEELVIYQHQTGDTHLFDGFSKQIISLCLSKDVFSVASLVEEMRDGFQDGNEGDVYIESLINELIHKELIINFSS